MQRGPVFYDPLGGMPNNNVFANSNTGAKTNADAMGVQFPIMGAWTPGDAKNLLSPSDRSAVQYQLYPNSSSYQVPNSSTTLFNIVGATGTQATELIAANPGVDFSNLQPGQQINLPPPNNSQLNVQTNTSSTVIQGGGSTDFDGTADNVSQGILINTGTETVSMNPVDVNEASTGDADALAASNIVADGFRPGNFNTTGSWFDPLSTVVDAVGGFFNGVGQTITAAYTNVANFLTNLWSYVDPVVLDLNGDGVKLTNYTEKPVLFDVDHDGGSLEVTGWVTPQDGILVHDLNSNGVIDNISETLSEYYNGTVGTGGDAGSKPFANGFAALKSLDSNLDNVFNSTDATFSQLRVWVDANSDGKTDAGELKTFAQLGITQINLANQAQSGEVRNGNEVLSHGTFVQSGQTKEAIAATFLANPNGTTFAQSGTGTMVTTQGNITSYASNSATGETIDVAAKAVMNAYGAQGNDTLIGDANDNWLAGGVGSDTFNAGAGDDVLLIDASDLQANIHAGAGRDIVHVIGDGGVTLNLAQAEVEIAEGGRGNDVFIAGGQYNVFIRGGEGNDLIIGGTANDALSGEEGNDLINGAGGNDLIRGHQGEDTLSGGPGDDIIEGGQDADKVDGGDGNDVLQGDQGDDKLAGGAGVDIAKFRGSYADYRVTYTTNGVWVSDKRAGRDGTDFLTGIEQLSFADVAHIPIEMPDPLPVNDVVMLPGSGAYLIPKATLLGNDLDYQGDTISIASVLDAVGGTAVLQASGDVLFTPDSSYSGLPSFAYRIRDSQNNPGITWTDASTGQSAESKAVVTLLSQGQPTDPLFSQQWYLSAANVLPVWKDYTGKGISIGQFEGGGNYAVSKEVFDYRHPDLASNVDSVFLASGTAPTDFSTHATLVAGVMAAARNGEGAVGVAYDAKLAGINIDKTDNLQQADYYALDQWQQYDIANNSWGVTPSFTANMLFPDINNPNPETYPIQDALNNAAEFGRGGLGTILVFAMGNDRATGGNTNYSNLDNSNFVIGVGAINAPGDLGALVLPQKPFSAPGASLLISAPGSNIVSTSRLQMNDNGSVFGNDSAVMQGTSLAAPIVSGIVALMLEANPNLGYRDVQEILAATAKQVDPTGSVWTFNHATGWNGGAMHVSDDYGFGLVDARAAVRLAETWDRTSTGLNGQSLTFDGTLNNTPIPDLGTVTNTITVPTGLRVEHASVTLDWDHQRWGDLIVKLISPTGTESVLMNRPDKAPGGPSTDFGNLSNGRNRFAFITTHDRGEDSGGNWQIQVTDAAGGQTGAVVSWHLQLIGQQLADGSRDPNDVYIYSDEFNALGTGSRAVLNDTNGGIDQINAAAVTGNTTINLAAGNGTIAGRALTISNSGNIENAIGGDGSDTLTGNTGANRLVGGRGNDVISGGAGQDVLDAGSGSDTLSGGADKDLFVISKASNTTDTITDFSLSTENILVVCFPNLTDFSNLTISQVGANSQVSLGDGQLLILNGTTSSALTADHFRFIEKFNFSGQFIGTNAADVGPTPLEIANSAVIDLGDQRQLYFLEGGDDRLFAGAGNDEIHGGDGNDFVVGENDSSDPVGGRDLIYGEAGDDVLFGGGGNDTLSGGAGHDEMVGNEGDDLLISGAGTDYMEGDAGDDVFYLEGEEDTAWGGAGNDRFLLRAGAYNAGGNGSPPDTGHDWIMDLEISNKQEKIDLSELTQVTSFSQLQFSDVVDPGFANTFLKVFVGPNTNDFFMVYNVTVSDVTAGRFNADNFIFAKSTSGNDTLTGDAGGTTLDGGLGADTMTGRTGDDTYIVDNAGDVVNELPGGGFDTVKASVTRALEADVENLVLTGTVNINGTGNEQNNRITGNSGNNILDGGAGADTLIGGAGNDTYIVDHGSDSILEQVGGGTDLIQSSVSFTLGSEVENLTLTGADNIDGTGNALGNVLTGNAGDNFLDGAAGADSLIGGAGNDTYLIDSADTVTEQANEGVDTVYAGFNYTLGSNVENLILIPGATTGTGNTLDNVITGNAVANMLTGNAGNDTLDGGTGNDTLVGGSGDDTYILDNASDSITETAGNGIDTVVAGFTYTLSTQLENLILTGIGNITGTGNASDNVLVGNSGANALSSDGGNDTLDGGAGADTLTGGTGNDLYVVDNTGDVVSENANEGTDTVQSSITYTLGANVENLTLAGFSAINGTGNSLNNVLAGNGAANVLTGGTGNDTYVVSTGDTVTEQANEGTDTVQSSITYTLGANLENLTLTGTANINGTGNSLNNALTGNSGNNVLDGGTGADTLTGGTGNDTYVVDNAGDSVAENANEGMDTVQSAIAYTLGANVENLTLTGSGNINGTGNSLDNVLIGNSGTNALSSDGGNDTLDGGVGADTLMGGTGNDTYVVDNAGDVVTEQANEGTDMVQSSVTYTLVDKPNLENLTLTGADSHTGTGNDLDNVITNANGVGTLVGGLGNDTYVIHGYLDVVTEQANQGTDTVKINTTYALSANVENLTFLETGYDFNGTGNSLANMLTGNSRNNVLDGGAGADTMIGGMGDDTYVVDNAGDVVTEQANEGRDTVQVGFTFSLASLPNLENVTLTGTSAINATGNVSNNVLTGNSGANTLTGGAGDDTYVIGSGVGDVIVENANEGSDTVQTAVSYTLVGKPNLENITLTGNNLTATGSSGTNVLRNFEFSTGNTLIGGQGDDTYNLGYYGAVVTEAANEGIDTVNTYDTYTLPTNVENMVVLGGGSDEYIITATGNALANVMQIASTGVSIEVHGGDGNDTIIGGDGGDYPTYGLTNFLYGDAGADSIQGGNSDETLNVDAADTFFDGGGGSNYLIVIGSVGMTIDAAAHHVYGINGGAGSDTLFTTGTDQVGLSGQAGNDVVTGGSGNDILSGGAGADRLDGGAGDDYIYYDASDLAVNGGPGIDGGAGTDWAVIGDYTGAAINLDMGQANLEKINTEIGNDTIFTTGTSAVVIDTSMGTDTLTGGSGNDSLNGGLGVDTMTGKSGDDTYYVSELGDSVIENAGEGIDTIWNQITWTLGANVENLRLSDDTWIDKNFNGTGNSLDNIITGNSGNNTLTGLAGNDKLDGGIGADTLVGGIGDDTYVRDNTSDVVMEQANEGTDTVQSSITYALGTNVENLMLTGTGNLNGTGNSLDNVLTGNSGANTLAGGAGNDTYMFSRSGGQDTVQDSSGTSDKMQFTSGINPLDLILEHNGNDLRLSLYNSTDRVTIQNWYSGTTNQTETIQAGNGQQLLNTQVDQLIQAMASFSTQTGLTWEQGLAQQPQNVQAVLAASWQ